MLTQPITLKSADGIQSDQSVPAIYIRNVGGNVIYPEQYLFNGREYPLGKEVLPPMSVCEGYRYIYLPTDGTTHVSLQIYFEDWQKKQWTTMVAPDKKTLKKSVKSMFFMVQTRCEVETIKY